MYRIFSSILFISLLSFFHSPAFAEITFGVGLDVGTSELTWQRDVSSTKSMSFKKLSLYGTGNVTYTLFDHQRGGETSAADTWNPFPNSSVSPTTSKNADPYFQKTNLIFGYRATDNFSVFGGLHDEKLGATFENSSGVTGLVKILHRGFILGVAYNTTVYVGSLRTVLGGSLTVGALDAELSSFNKNATTTSSHLNYGVRWIFPITESFNLDLNYTYTTTSAEFDNQNIGELVNVTDVHTSSTSTGLQLTYIF